MNELSMGPRRTCAKHFFFKYKINPKTRNILSNERLSVYTANDSPFWYYVAL